MAGRQSWHASKLHGEIGQFLDFMLTGTAEKQREFSCNQLRGQMQPISYLELDVVSLNEPKAACDYYLGRTLS